MSIFTSKVFAAFPPLVHDFSPQGCADLVGTLSFFWAQLLSQQDLRHLRVVLAQRGQWSGLGQGV